MINKIKKLIPFGGKHLLIKSRDEATKLINRQFRGKESYSSNKKNNRHHYGKQELMQLLDLIYGADTENKQIRSFNIDKE